MTTKKKTTSRKPKNPAAKKPRVRNPLDLKPGTKLTRTFKGKEITVTVTKDGFEYQDQAFKSISAVARRITGYGISGPVFFGLTKTEEKK